MRYEEEIQFVLKHKSFSSPKFWMILKIIALFLFSILCLTVSGFIIYFLSKTDTFGLKAVGGSIFLLIVTLFYGFSILINLKNEWLSSRTFTEFKTNLSSNENLNLMTKIFKDNFRIKELEIDKKNNVVSILTKISLLTWGTHVTAVCDEKRILVNSRSTGQQPFSYGKNKRNIILVDAEINKHFQQEDVFYNDNKYDNI